MLDEASGQVLVKYGVGLSGKDGVDAVWTGSDGCIIRWNGVLNGIREQEPKAVFDVEKTSINSCRTSPKALMTAGDQPEPWSPNLMSRRCKGTRS